MTRGVIFDLDGTLIETEQAWDEVRRGLAAQAGLEWPEHSTKAMLGMSTQEWSRHLVNEVGLDMTPEQAAKATIDRMAQHHHDGLTVLPGAVEAVRRMAERYPLAIASSSPRVLIDAAVESLGIGDLLQATVSTEEVAKGKPAPDGYLRAAQLLGIAPAQCAAVEDSTNGIASALNAGMQVVAVPMKFEPPAAEVLARATVIDSLDQLTPSLVEGLG